MKAGGEKKFPIKIFSNGTPLFDLVSIAIFFTCFVILLGSANGRPVQENDVDVKNQSDSIRKKNVLVLNAYHESFHWTDQIMSGVKSVFKDHEEVELFINYMDAKRCSDATYFQQLKNLYQYKYKNIEFDAIIATDDHALDFLLNYRDLLFGPSPVIFCGINDFLPSRIEGHGGFSGVYESYDVQGTLQLILSLHPNTKEIVVVADASLSGKAFDRKIKRAASKFENQLSFRYLNNLKPEGIAANMRSITEESVVLWSLYIRKPDGTVVTSKESIALITQNTQRPVYCIWDVVGDGVVGGKVTDPVYQGEKSAGMVLQILGGTSVDLLPIEGSPMVYKFDYNQLNKHGINEKLLPANYTMVNKPFSFYESYQTEILVIASVIIALVSMVFVLIYFVQYQRRAKLEISAKNQNLVLTGEMLQESNKKLSKALEAAKKSKALELANKELRKNKKIQQRLNKELKISNLTKDKFFTIIAHDLKGPFHSVIGAAKILKENFDDLKVEEQKEFLEVIEGTVKNGYKLLENLLLWSRSQSGQIDFKPEKLDFGVLVEETVELLRQSAKNKSIEIIVELAPALQVLVDKDMALSILRNLLSNAIKFTTRGGLVQLRTEKWQNQEGNWLLKIAVKDSGVGMSGTVRSHLFDLGNNKSSIGTEKETGTGLGLILCKEFVERHGGEIWAESEIELGSEFVFTLPLAVGGLV